MSTRNAAVSSMDIVIAIAVALTMLKAEESHERCPRSVGSRWGIADLSGSLPIETFRVMKLPIRWRRALSRPIDAIPVTIGTGPNRGSRWSLPISGRGFGAGRFEVDKFEALEALLSPGDVFWDVGAHYGYATLLGARIAGPGGSVWSFEPSALNRSYLHRHVLWNCSDTVTLMPYALADADGLEAFGGQGSSMALGLGRGSEEVGVRTVGSLLKEGIPEPTIMKIDVEGAESRMLQGAMATRVRPTVMCSVHDSEQLELCADLLKRAGYVVLPSRPIRAFLDGRSPWRGDPDLVAVAEGQALVRARLDATELYRGAEAL